jgi:hypothetical protein
VVEELNFVDLRSAETVLVAVTPTSRRWRLSASLWVRTYSAPVAPSIAEQLVGRELLAAETTPEQEYHWYDLTNDGVADH